MPLRGPMCSGSECYLTLELGFQGYWLPSWRVPDSLPNPASSSLRDSRQRSLSFHIYKVMAKSFHPRLVRIQGNGTFMGLVGRDFQLGNSTRVLSNSKETNPWGHIRASCLWKIGFQSAQRLDGKHVFLLPSWR